MVPIEECWGESYQNLSIQKQNPNKNILKSNSVFFKLSNTVVNIIEANGKKWFGVGVTR